MIKTLKQIDTALLGLCSRTWSAYYTTTRGCGSLQPTLRNRVFRWRPLIAQARAKQANDTATEARGLIFRRGES